MTDRAFARALRKAGAYKEALILSVLGEAHRAYNQRGLSLKGRCNRLLMQKILIHCMFGSSMFVITGDAKDKLSRSHMMGLPSGTLLDMVANADGH